MMVSIQSAPLSPMTRRVPNPRMNLLSSQPNPLKASPQLSIPHKFSVLPHPHKANTQIYQNYAINFMRCILVLILLVVNMIIRIQVEILVEVLYSITILKLLSISSEKGVRLSYFDLLLLSFCYITTIH
jgi:hypothetical protein